MTTTTGTWTEVDGQPFYSRNIWTGYTYQECSGSHCPEPTHPHWTVWKAKPETTYQDEWCECDNTDTDCDHSTDESTVLHLGAFITDEVWSEQHARDICERQ